MVYTDAFIREQGCQTYNMTFVIAILLANCITDLSAMGKTDCGPYVRLPCSRMYKTSQSYGNLTLSVLLTQF